MERGFFIVLEGGEGAGKGTCVSFLKNYFSGKNSKQVVFTREPGGTPYGEQLRSSLLSVKNSGQISVLSELFTFCAIRANHCDFLIRPALAEGKVVICDRFDPATVAYQIYGREQHQMTDIFLAINQYAKGFGQNAIIDPDLVIYLDVEPKTGLQRVKNRSKETTRFDAEKISFHEKVRIGYLEQAKSQNWAVVDTTHIGIEDVQNKVLSLILNLIDEKEE